MVHGYHIILLLYGFWLPNDPRGSWSDFVWKWELVRFGKATKRIERRDLNDLSTDELRQRELAKRNLKYPPVSLTGKQALGVAQGFADRVRKSNYTVWACAILPEHVHLVLARHAYAAEQMAKLLKGAATLHLKTNGLHPQEQFADPDLPRCWAESQWIVFLDSEEQIENAIRYVEENPEEEGKPRQHWRFVSPFRGLDAGCVNYH